MDTEDPLLWFVMGYRNMLPILTRRVRHNRPSYSGYNAYPSVCVVSSCYEALWNAYPGPDPRRSGVHQGITI
jgi:hypothetical protein